MGYMMESLIDIYEDELQIIGVWHKHNHDMGVFSSEDDLLHKKLSETFKCNLASILFQKTETEEYKFSVYKYHHATSKLTEEEFEIVDLSKEFPYKQWI